MSGNLGLPGSVDHDSERANDPFEGDGIVPCRNRQSTDSKFAGNLKLQNKRKSSEGLPKHLGHKRSSQGTGLTTIESPMRPCESIESRSLVTSSMSFEEMVLAEVKELASRICEAHESYARLQVEKCAMLEKEFAGKCLEVDELRTQFDLPLVPHRMSSVVGRKASERGRGSVSSSFGSEEEPKQTSQKRPSQLPRTSSLGSSQSGSSIPKSCVNQSLRQRAPENHIDEDKKNSQTASPFSTQTPGKTVDPSPIPPTDPSPMADTECTVATNGTRVAPSGEAPISQAWCPIPQQQGQSLKCGTASTAEGAMSEGGSSLVATDGVIPSKVIGVNAQHEPADEGLDDSPHSSAGSLSRMKQAAPVNHKKLSVMTTDLVISKVASLVSFDSGANDISEFKNENGEDSYDERFEIASRWVDKHSAHVQRPSHRGTLMGSGIKGLKHSAQLEDDSGSDTDSDMEQKMIETRELAKNDTKRRSLDHVDADVVYSSEADFDDFEVGKLRLLLRHLVLKPSSLLRIVFDFIGCIFIAYDCVLIPTQFLNLKESSFVAVMAWLIRIFWAIELPVSMLTSFTRRNGKLEGRPERVIKHYLSRWFSFDIAMVLFDWTDLLLQDSWEKSQAVGRAVQLARLARIVRAMRVLKMRHTPEFIQSLAYYFHSEMTVILFGIVKLILFLVWINHFIACCWYGIGNATRGSERNWLQSYEVGESLLDHYATSFLWSLSLFASGPVEMEPQNMRERTYTICCLLFAFVVAAWVVSSITSALTRLEIATAEESQKFNSLKQYLFDHRISGKVALRVQRNAHYAWQQKTRCREESSVELLSLISEPLRIDLHYEINSPVLANHLFFKSYCTNCTAVMRHVCHTAVYRLSLTKGDVLFSDGEMSATPCMYFVVAGKVRFMHTLQDGSCRTQDQGKNIHVGRWFCEATLWTEWVHCGSMIASTETTLLVLDAGLFQRIVTRSEVQWLPCYRYASHFVEYLNEQLEEYLTDDHDFDMDIESWVVDAYPTEEALMQEYRPRQSQM